MQLRTHPKMKWEGFSNWPPTWGGSYGSGDIFPIGEEGNLKDVEMLEEDQAELRGLTLTIEHRGNTSSGLLYCDDTTVVPRLYDILRGCLGWSISQIGDLDVDL